MMKGKLQITVATLLMLLIVSNTNYSQNMQLSGAGTTVANGIYLADGTFDGVVKYKKDDIYLFRRSGVNWICGKDLGNWTNVYYYTASSANTPDGLTLDTDGDLGSGNKPSCSNTAVPVELTNFIANIIAESVILNWQTATEVNNYGFEILRSTQNDEWEEIGFVDGHGNSNSPKEYSFVDSDKLFGIIQYRLKQIDIDGSFEYSDVIEVELTSSLEYKLAQNSPNPFNPSTKITFTIPETGVVKLNIYNVLGEVVSELVNENLEAGFHQYQFNAINLTSGIYFYSISVNGFTEVKKMNLIK